MGFFSSIAGWDKSMAALNAVMGSHVMENSAHSTKVMITDEIAKIISSALYGKLNKESILSGLSQESRVVQMNFVALACDNLRIEPPFKNSYWERIKNPYKTGSQVDEITIEGAIKAFRKDGNTGITWPGISNSFDFESLYRGNSDMNNQALDAMAISMATRFILCFNSYLSDKTQLPILEARDMDAITEKILSSQSVETDQFLFMRYCYAVHQSVAKQLVDDIKNDRSLGRDLRYKLDFDKSFRSYCIDLGLNHLLEAGSYADEVHNNDTLYRKYISEEDEAAFSKDLMKFIDTVFNHTYSKLLNEGQPKNSFEISQDDIDAFGTDLAGCIGLYTTQAIIKLRSCDKALSDAMYKVASDALGDTFGPDLLDFIKRYCAYKATSLN